METRQLIPAPRSNAVSSLQELQETVIACTRCPRLVEYLRKVSQEKRRSYRDWDYWGRPLPSFGDPKARVLLVGLAPAAHGGNRTGRMFTGDRSGDWLYETLHKFGFASMPSSRHREDGLTLTDLYITAAVGCAPHANRPLPEERHNSSRYLLRELELLKTVRVVVPLGKYAFDAYMAAHRDLGGPSPEGPPPRPRFGHGAVPPLGQRKTLICAYHPSQQDTQTGRLTLGMFEQVFATVRELLT